jgi:hypothetical protein
MNDKIKLTPLMVCINVIIAQLTVFFVKCFNNDNAAKKEGATSGRTKKAKERSAFPAKSSELNELILKSNANTTVMRKHSGGTFTLPFILLHR